MSLSETTLLPFKPFDESGEVRIYYNGFLPHWRQAGCTYFVTFRLADSIPDGVLQQWKYERGMWLQARGIDMSSEKWPAKFKQLSSNEKKLFERHFVSKFFAALDDSLGDCVLRNPQHAKLVSDALLYFQGQRLDTGDFVVMPNHVHALLTPYPGFELENILHSIKSYTANQIQTLRGSSGTLWMNETHDHIARDGEELVRIQEYIRANPAKAGLSTNEFILNTSRYKLH